MKPLFNVIDSITTTLPFFMPQWKRIDCEQFVKKMAFYYSREDKILIDRLLKGEIKR